MATLRERKTRKGERRWQALVRRQGLPDKVATFRTKREAERWAQIEEGDIAAARHLPGLAAERHTVGQLIAKYRATLTDKRRVAIGKHLDW